MKFTFHQLKIFRSVAKHKNYTHAANSLHLSQPAVSMQIKQLESIVGLPLLEQVGKKLFLTEAGETILQCAKSIDHLVQDTQERLHQQQGIQRGTFKISVATTASYFITGILAQFSDLYPEISISLDVTNRHTLLEQLQNNERDLIIMGEPPSYKGLIAQSFMDNPLVMIASPKHPLVKQKNITLDDLANQTFVIREKGSGTRAAIERFFDAGNAEIHSTMEMSSNEAIKQAVQAGLGLAIVSSHTVELELETKHLVKINAKDFPIIRQWYVVHHEGKRLSPVASLFHSFILDGDKEKSLM